MNRELGRVDEIVARLGKKETEQHVPMHHSINWLTEKRQVQSSSAASLSEEWTAASKLALPTLNDDALKEKTQQLEAKTASTQEEYKVWTSTELQAFVSMR